jgi:predicted 3-demethylubiquinone-9 3-methyltransferase (glyoxalase superfamily)
MKILTLASLVFASLCLRQPLADRQASDLPRPVRPKIVPCLWFDDDAEEAIRFWGTVFPDLKVLSELRWGEGAPLPKGTLMTARFTLAGQEYMVLNGGPAYRLNESISLVVSCETQAEIDTYWDKLLAGGGQPNLCGWLKDKFGLSWQVVPSSLAEMLSDKDTAKAQRVAAAMMQMDKLDLARLKQALEKP